MSPVISPVQLTLFDANDNPGSERHGMTTPMMADVHCHLLPNVDDGSRSVEQSLGILKLMREGGIGDVCLTPHVAGTELRPDQLEQRLEELNRATASLRAAAADLPRLHRGVELMLNTPLEEQSVVDRRLTLAGSRYLLVEFPTAMSPDSIRGLLRQVVERGFVPVVAHPERYAAATSDEVYQWREIGSAVQLDATTLVRRGGSRTARAREFLAEGLADILAADNHGDDRLLCGVTEAFLEVEGDIELEILTSSNPRAMLHDAALERVPPVTLSRGLMDRIRDILRP